MSETPTVAEQAAAPPPPDGSPSDERRPDRQPLAFMLTHQSGVVIVVALRHRAGRGCGADPPAGRGSPVRVRDADQAGAVRAGRAHPHPAEDRPAGAHRPGRRAAAARGPVQHRWPGPADLRRHVRRVGRLRGRWFRHPRRGARHAGRHRRRRVHRLHRRCPQGDPWGARGHHHDHAELHRRGRHVVAGHRPAPGRELQDQRHPADRADPRVGPGRCRRQDPDRLRHRGPARGRLLVDALAQHAGLPVQHRRRQQARGPLRRHRHQAASSPCR